MAVMPDAGVATSFAVHMRVPFVGFVFASHSYRVLSRSEFFQ
jgi:hypothetical protein